MAYNSLRDFMQHLENEGALVRVQTPVSPELEMTEIQTRLLAEGGRGGCAIIVQKVPVGPILAAAQIIF